MTSADIVARLKAMEPQLRAAGLDALYLFGSRARGDHRADSDVDLLFDVAASADERFSYFDLFRLRDGMADTLSLPVDLVDRRGLHRLVASHVEADLRQVF